jgi:hypothetical protein
LPRGLPEVMQKQEDDRWGFSHEVPNLEVRGACVVGTSGPHNPPHTIQALAWRPRSIS